jgi:hypothetical protein
MNEKWKAWIRRVGVAGLIFFTLKGIAWLVIFYFGANAIAGC